MRDNPVGGVPVVDPAGTGPAMEATSITAGADAVVDFNDWLNAPTQFRYTWYACTDAVDTSTCSKLGTYRINTPATSASLTTDDTYVGYYVRAFVQAINANGFGPGVWTTNATLVNAVS